MAKKDTHPSPKDQEITEDVTLDEDELLEQKTASTKGEDDTDGNDPSDTSEETSETASLESSDETSDKTSDETSGEVPNETLNDLPEQAIDDTHKDAHKEADVEAPEKVHEEMHEDTHAAAQDESPDCVDEAITEQILSDAPENTSDSTPTQKPAGTTSGKHAKHAPDEKPRKKTRKERLAEMPEFRRRSRRTRNMLILVLIVIFILLGVLLYLGYQLLETSRSIVSQQPSQTSEVAEVSQNDEATKDASSTNTKSTEAPDLVKFIGKTQDEVVKLLGSGATVSQTQTVNEEDNPIKTRATIVLTEEVADVKSGTPSVYLGLDADGSVIMAGYSAPTSLLGYGSYSFSEAITNQHIIENTFKEAGVNLPTDAIVLPEKDSYTTYASDGKTIVKESASFEGTTSVDDTEYSYSSVLTYDYTARNASGKLSDTIRQIYVYIQTA